MPFPERCAKCKRKLGESEMIFARPVDGNMSIVCNNCCKEWDKENRESYTNVFLKNFAETGGKKK